MNATDEDWACMGKGSFGCGAMGAMMTGKLKFSRPSIRRVQPPDSVRGDIARTMLYMQDTYGFRLSRQDQQLYAAWNNADPPDAWEIERDKRIARVQGKGNEYVSQYRRL